MNPLCTLAPASILLGAASMWTFRRMTDRHALRTAANRIQAHLLEFWLFVDEPSLMWKSWSGLIAAIVRLNRLLLVPLLLLSIPMAPLFFFLDNIYGSEPLAVGKPAVVTLGMSRPLDQISILPRMEAPAGISIEGPPVRVWSAREVSWRIRPLRPLSGELHWTVNGTSISKNISAGHGFHYHSRRRTRSLEELIRYPTEQRLPAGPVEWIEIAYPLADVSALGLDLPWWFWFIAFSGIGAAILPR